MEVQLHERKYPNGKVAFYLHYSVDGNRNRERLRLPLALKNSPVYRRYKMVAKTLQGERQKEIIEGTYGLRLSFDQNLSLEDLFSMFMEETRHKELKRKQAILKYLKAYNDLYNYRKSPLAISVDEVYCEGFRDHLLQSLSPETTRNYFAVFKRGLKYGRIKKLIPYNPADQIRVHGSNRMLTRDILTADELKLLFGAHCEEEQVKWAFLFSCNTGITLPELKDIKWSDLRSGLVHYSRHKNKRRVAVPLNPNSVYIIQKLKETNRKDPGPFHSLPSAFLFNKALGNWIRDHGIQKHITAYCARHTFGTLQANNGVNQKIIAANMGHSSTKYTDIYINHVDEAKVRAVNFGDFTNDLEKSL